MLAFSGVVTVWGVNTSKIVAVRGYYFRRLLFRGKSLLLEVHVVTFRGYFFWGVMFLEACYIQEFVTFGSAVKKQATIQ